MDATSLLQPTLAAALAPLMLAIVNRVKARFAGRTGPPLMQPYFDIAKLLRKGSVYSATTTWVFKAGPAVGLAAVFVAVLLLPLGPSRAPLAFEGDLFLLAGLFALQRFALMLAALDTGSSFEGMGASREAFFAALGEPALIVGLVVAARGAASLSLSGLLGATTLASVAAAGPALLLVVVALFLLMLSENARIPVDDPNTHLELTMVHEVMVLDHSGVDLAYISYAAALKFWVFAALIVGLLVPTGGLPVEAAVPVFLASMVGLAAAVGVVESTMARVRMARVPRLLVAAGGLTALALLLTVF
jgi:formate hydrogenlyase subunit 4